MTMGILGTILFSSYLIYDTQLILEGRHKRSIQISSEDYIMAAMSLYLDIIILFLYILELAGTEQESLAHGGHGHGGGEKPKNPGHGEKPKHPGHHERPKKPSHHGQH